MRETSFKVVAPLLENNNLSFKKQNTLSYIQKLTVTSRSLQLLYQAKLALSYKSGSEISFRKVSLINQSSLSLPNSIFIQHSVYVIYKELLHSSNIYQRTAIHGADFRVTGYILMTELTKQLGQKFLLSSYSSLSSFFYSFQVTFWSFGVLLPASPRREKLSVRGLYIRNSKKSRTKLSSEH